MRDASRRFMRESQKKKITQEFGTSPYKQDFMSTSRTHFCSLLAPYAKNKTLYNGPQRA